MLNGSMAQTIETKFRNNRPVIREHVSQHIILYIYDSACIVGPTAIPPALMRTDVNTFKLFLVMFCCVTQGTMQVASAAAAQEGEASYHADSLNGEKTASSELYDKDALSTAHRSPPSGKKVKLA